MSRKISLWCVAGLMALGLLIPMVSQAQEPSIVSPVQGEISTPNQMPDVPGSSQDQEPLSLEDIKKMVGAHNVCGVFCGRNDPTVTNCTFACGDAAFCFYGSCVYH